MKNIIKIKIHDYTWTVRFLTEKQMGETIFGTTWYNERAIDIRDNLDDIATEITIMHELVHAFLDSQGRIYQKQFELEDMCEFIGWNANKIVELKNYIMNERRK